jgi:small subunit ribosomal protein S20
MANIQSQTKRIITNLKATVHNTTFKAQMRTAVKRVKALVAKQDMPAANTALNHAVKLIDKSVAHGIQKKQTAARQKSRLMSFVAQQSKVVKS